MGKSNTNEKIVIALAYLHRYGWIALMVICAAIWIEHSIYILATGSLCFSVWSFIGYKMKWKHIFCSFQNAYHLKMTPNNTQWNTIRKSDAYGVPLLFFIAGTVILVVKTIW